MLRRLRRGLTYSNVTATMALVVAMGGGAYALTKGEVRSEHIANNAVKSKHIAQNAVKGADVKEASLKGIGSGLVGGTWEQLSGGYGGRALAAVGRGTAGEATWIVAPQDLTIADFTVSIVGSPQNQGIREFRVQEPSGTKYLEPLCTIGAGEQGCSSSVPVTIPKGQLFRFWVSFSGTPATADVAFSWRALTR